jgi:hypothetical protein
MFNAMVRFIDTITNHTKFLTIPYVMRSRVSENDVLLSAIAPMEKVLEILPRRVMAGRVDLGMVSRC